MKAGVVAEVGRLGRELAVPAAAEEGTGAGIAGAFQRQTAAVQGRR